MGDITLNGALRARPVMASRLAWLAALLVTLAGTLALAAPSAAAAARSGGRAVAAPPGVSVLGSQLLKDGVPWLPRGVQIVGLVAPDGALSGKYIAAHQNFSARELSQAVAQGADTVRFQVSQFGLDPNNTLYSPAYVQEIQNAVHLARGLGLMVIVSVQAEPPAGGSSRCPLPDTNTERVWTELALMFGNDRGVMFELYNEPALFASATNWQLWLNGGNVVQGGETVCQAVGVQSLVDVIRSEQAPNVIIVPGLSGELTLAGMPTVVDPANPADPQLAYGVHYPSLASGISRWNQAFGQLASVVPVIVTEWDQNSTHDCITNAPTASTFLLDYLISKQIGLVGFAFDLPGTIVADYSYAPTSFQRFACGVPNGGPGELLFTEYAGLAQADGPSQVVGAPAWIVTGTVLRTLSTLAPGVSRHFFDTPRAYVVGANATTLAHLSDPAALPTARFTNENVLAAAVTSGTLPIGTRAVMFQDEFGPRTPRAQQRNPAAYYKRAAQVAHSAGLLLIAAPATNLVLARHPRTRPSREYAAFVKLGIAGAVARSADVYEIDAQGNQAHPSRYASFVRQVSSQATAAHPGVELLAGLSTNPNGVKQSSKALLKAALPTQTLVAGFALNDPGSPRQCKRCGVWYAAAAKSFLRGLLSHGG